MKTEKKKILGRPSMLFKTLKPQQLTSLSKFGLTEKQMSEVIGISEVTFNSYKKNGNFLSALKRGKKLADKIVEASLFKRATGYSCTEDKVFCERGKVTVVPTIKHYPPDPTAMIFWLKNRDPKRWRDNVEFVGNIEHRMVLIRPGNLLPLSANTTKIDQIKST